MNEMENVIKEFKNSLNNDDSIDTGFENINEFLSNILKGSIITIGARPGMGKTTLILSFINNFLKQYKKIDIFSLETSKYDFLKQLISEKCNEHLQKSYHRKNFSYFFENELMAKKISDAVDFYSDKDFNITDKTNLNIEDLESDIQKFKPEIVFIDNVQRIKMPKAPNLTEATNLVVSEIKRIAIENDVIVFLTSQLSRACELRPCKKPILSDLRNGSLLEEISDIIMFIFRERYYDCSAERNVAEIIFAKNKFGYTDKTILNFENWFFREIIPTIGF